MQFYNVHSHVFTMENAPQRFLHLYMPDIAANLVDKITNTQVGAKSMEWILSHFAGSGGRRYASFLRIGKSKNQLEVFEYLIKQYDDSSIKLIALTINMEECGAGNSETGFEGQLEGVLEIKRRYPDRVLIFMGIDPRWISNGTDIKNTVVKYFEKKLQINETTSIYPFTGLKLYPSTGFYVFDQRLKETFEWAAENEVPILSHCNYLGGIYNNNKSYIEGNLNSYDPYVNKYYNDYNTSNPAVYQYEKRFWKRLLGTNESTNNLNSCSYFLEPASYRTILQYFKNKNKNLKICLAHYGGDDQILNENVGKNPQDIFGVQKQNWCGQIKALLNDFPNVYTDISYAVHNIKTHDILINDLSNPVFGDQIMFGTDFFLTEREQPEKNTYGIFKQKAIGVKTPTGITAWEQIAGRNTEQFLKSKYYP